MQSLEITKDDYILIIAPHPDDECTGPGGILVNYPAQCEVLVLTDGRQGQGKRLPEEEKAIRRKEFVAEMAYLGITRWRILDIEDGTLLQHTDCLKDIHLSDFTKVFTTGAQDEHPDHKAAYLSVVKAIQEVEEKKRPTVFIYEVHTPLQAPTHFFDITECGMEKRMLIRFHASQTAVMPYDLLAEQCAAYRGTLFRMSGRMLEVYEEVAFDGNMQNTVLETERKLQKQVLFYWVMTRWLDRLLDYDGVAAVLQRREIGRVSVYGYGELGRILVKELLRDGVEVASVIDRRAKQLDRQENLPGSAVYGDTLMGEWGGETKMIPLVRPDEAWEKETPVIVTAVGEFETVKKALEERGFSDVFSLRMLLEERRGT